MTATIDRYAEYLAPHLSPGFAFREIVKPGSRTKQFPPERMWRNIVDTLALANELRHVMVTEHGAKGLRVNAAFRPVGGAANSQHKHNRALDLDLLPGDYGLTRAYYDEAVKLWCEHGREQRMGLGLYCPADAQQGIRVHLDTHWAVRTWQHGARAGKADAFVIADRLGLHVPTLREPADDEGSDEHEDTDA